MTESEKQKQMDRVKEQNDLNDEFLEKGPFKNSVAQEQELKELGVKEPYIQRIRMAANAIEYINSGKSRYRKKI